MEYRFNMEDFYKDWDDTHDVVVATVRVPIDMECSDIANQLINFLVEVGILIPGDTFKVCKVGDEVVLAKGVHYLNFDTTVN